MSDLAMTQEYFKAQITRMKVKFGDRAFDVESCRLFYREVDQLPQWIFLRAVEAWLGQRKHTNAPKLDCFRAVRLNYEQYLRKLEREAASKALTQPAAFDGLKRCLALNYKGAKTLMEAVEIERLKHNISEANEVDKRKGS
jgi:hypothetical protein